MSSMSPILTRAPSLSLAPSPLSSPRLSPSHALSRSPVPPLPDSDFVKMASTFLDVEALEALGLADVATSSSVAVAGESDDTVMGDASELGGQWGEFGQVGAWGMQAQVQVQTQGRQISAGVGPYAGAGQYGMQQQWDVGTGWAVQTGEGWAVTAADGQAQTVGGYMHSSYQPAPTPSPYTDAHPHMYATHTMHVPVPLPVPDQHQHQYQQYTSYTHTALHVHASPGFHAVSAPPLSEVHAPLQPPPAPKSTYSHTSLFAPAAFDASASIPGPHAVTGPPPQPVLLQPPAQQPQQPQQPPPPQHQPPPHQPLQHHIPPPHILAPSLLTHALASWRLSRSHLARSACLLYFPSPPDPTSTPTPTGAPTPPPPPPPPALSPHVLLALCHLVFDHANDADTALDAARAIVGDAKRAERQRWDEERARWARGVAEGVVDWGMDVDVDGGVGGVGGDIPLYFTTHTTLPPLPALIAAHLSTHLPLPHSHSLAHSHAHSPPTPLTPSAHLLLSRLRPLLHPSLLPHASRAARTDLTPLHAAVGHAVAGSAGTGEWDAVVGAVGGGGVGGRGGVGGMGPWGRRVDAEEVAVRVGVLVGKDEVQVEFAEAEAEDENRALEAPQEQEQEQKQGHVSMHDVHPAHAHASSSLAHPTPLPFPLVPPNSRLHPHTDSSFPAFPPSTSTTTISTHLHPPTTLLPPSDVLYAPYTSIPSGSNGSWHPVLIRRESGRGCALCLAQGGDEGVGGVWEWKSGAWFCPSCTLLTSSTTSSPRSSPRIKPRPPPLDILRALSASSSALLGLATPPPSASARDKSPPPPMRIATPITHMFGAGLLTPFASPTRPVDSTLILEGQHPAPTPTPMPPLTALAPGTPNGLPKPTIRIPLRAFSNPRLKQSSSSLLSIFPLISPLMPSEGAPVGVGEVLTVAGVESEGRPRVTRANSVAMLEADGASDVQGEAARAMGDSQSTLVGDTGSSSGAIVITSVEMSAKKLTPVVDVVVAVKVETVDEGGQVKATQGVKRKRGGRKAAQVAAQ